MVSVLKPLILAIHMAKKTRDELAAHLRRCKQSMSNAQAQMDQLCSYSDETHQKWLLASKVGVSPEIMRHQIQFMARLQEAIVLQQSVLKNIDADIQRVQKNYLGSELRLASLELMQKKLQLNVDALQKRKEQKQTDEFASARKPTLFESV
jgi:flagellar FliJ protein